MRSLTATAQANSGERRAQAASAIAADGAGTLQRFRQLVEESQFSSTADKIFAWDEPDEMVDTRRFHVYAAGGDAAEGRRRFEKSQPGDRDGVGRQGFEDLWEHGRRLVYGAVNAGGMGAEEFGSICVVIADPEQPPPDALAVFPGDSVERYTTPAGEVEELRAVAEATSWGDRADLAVAEMGSEVAGASEAGWPPVVCRSGRYLEVTRAGEAPLRSVAEVRLRQPRVDRLAELYGREVAREALSPIERNEVAFFDVLRKWRRSQGTAINAVPWHEGAA